MFNMYLSDICELDLANLTHDLSICRNIAENRIMLVVSILSRIYLDSFTDILWLPVDVTLMSVYLPS